MVYVDPSAPDLDSDGTEAHPYPLVETALRRSSPGDVIALARGTYSEAIELTKAVTLWGACVQETILSSPLGPAIEAVDAGGAVIGNLTVTGPGAGIVAFDNSTALVVDSVMVRSVSVAGLVAINANLEVRDAAVRDVQDEGGIADGVEVVEGGLLDLARVVLERTGSQGVFVGGASTLVARDVAVLDGRPDAAGDFGMAFNILEGSRVELDRVVGERSFTYGIALADEGTELVATDLRVTGTEPRAREGDFGEGIFVGPGAHAELARASLVDNRSAGVWISEDADCVASDVVVTDTRANDADPYHGEGFAVSGSFVGERLAVLRSTGAGIYVDGTATLHDVLVRETTGPVGDEGDGIVVVDGAHLDLERAVLEGNGRSGVNIQGVGTVATLLDLVAADSSPVPVPGARIGIGVAIRDGARATIERALVAGNRAGVGVGGADAVLEGRDLAIEDTDPDPAGFGLALVAGGHGSSVTLDRTVIARNVSYAIGATEEARVVLTDVVIRETTERDDCPPDLCAGIAVTSIDRALVEVTHFIIADNVLAGVQVAGGEVDLHDGRVSGNPIGANVQDEDFDVARLEDRVVYVDNERNLDTVSLPVPEFDGFRP